MRWNAIAGRLGSPRSAHEPSSETTSDHQRMKQMLAKPQGFKPPICAGLTLGSRDVGGFPPAFARVLAPSDLPRSRFDTPQRLPRRTNKKNQKGFLRACSTPMFANILADGAVYRTQVPRTAGKPPRWVLSLLAMCLSACLARCRKIIGRWQPASSLLLVPLRLPPTPTPRPCRTRR